MRKPSSSPGIYWTYIHECHDCIPGVDPSGRSYTLVSSKKKYQSTMNCTSQMLHTYPHLPIFFKPTIWLDILYQNGAVKRIGFNTNHPTPLGKNHPTLLSKIYTPVCKTTPEKELYFVFVWLILTYIFFGSIQFGKWMTYILYMIYEKNILFMVQDSCEQAHLGLIRSHREQFLWYTDTLLIHPMWSRFFSPLAIHQSSKSSHALIFVTHVRHSLRLS